MSKVINVIMDGECYLMPVKVKSVSSMPADEIYRCLHCNSSDAFQVVRSEQLILPGCEVNGVIWMLVICPDCQCASEYHTTA